MLRGGNLTKEDLQVRWHDGLPFFLKDDLLACLFYVLSRYEEYEDYEADNHGRFPASNSHALTNNYLHLPVARLWAKLLYQQLRLSFPALPEPKLRPLVFRPTYDIDILWAYKFRGWKGIASGLRDLFTGKFLKVRERFLQWNAPDPYDILPELFALHPQQKPQLFWLLANNESREDVNPYPVPAAQVVQMQSLVEAADMGIHPGYRSLADEAKVKAEIDTFRSIFGRQPRSSRQHFLRFRLPESYRQLRLLGITAEYSMGYADAVGWRAGTNLPFPWYDLEKEEHTGLTVHPFVAMDATLKNYLGLTAQEAVVVVKSLADDCRPLGGDFSLLWHNSSFAEAHGWKGWRAGYQAIIAHLTDDTSESI